MWSHVFWGHGVYLTRGCTTERRLQAVYIKHRAGSWALLCQSEKLRWKTQTLPF